MGAQRPRRPFSGPVLNPVDRHAPPGTPFRHGWIDEAGHTSADAAPNQIRQPGDVHFVRAPLAGRTGTEHKGHVIVRGADTTLSTRHHHKPRQQGRRARG